MKYYLAYGSNLSVEQMAYRCPHAVCVGTGVIHGYRLLFKGSKTGNYLTIEPMQGRTVPVLIWRVTDSDEDALDRYEGYPVFYRKETTRIRMRSFEDPLTEREVDAFVYIMNEGRTLGKPTDRYYRVCLEGYRRFGFDERTLVQAYMESA